MPDLEELRDADKRDFLLFVEELVLEQSTGGRLLLGENPLSSDAKERPPLQRLHPDIPNAKKGRHREKGDIGRSDL